MKQDNHRLAYFPKLPSSPAPKGTGDGGGSLEALMNTQLLPFTQHAPPPSVQLFSYHTLHHNLSLLHGSAHRQGIKRNEG